MYLRKAVRLRSRCRLAGDLRRCGPCRRARRWRIGGDDMKPSTGKPSSRLGFCVQRGGQHVALADTHWAGCAAEGSWWRRTIFGSTSLHRKGLFLALRHLAAESALPLPRDALAVDVLVLDAVGRRVGQRCSRRRHQKPTFPLPGRSRFRRSSGRAWRRRRGMMARGAELPEFAGRLDLFQHARTGRLWYRRRPHRDAGHRLPMTWVSTDGSSMTRRVPSMKLTALRPAVWKGNLRRAGSAPILTGERPGPLRPARAVARNAIAARTGPPGALSGLRSSVASVDAFGGSASIRRARACAWVSSQIGKGRRRTGRQLLGVGHQVRIAAKQVVADDSPMSWRSCAVRAWNFFNGLRTDRTPTLCRPGPR